MRALQVVLVNEQLTVREEEAVNYLSACEPYGTLSGQRLGVPRG